MRQNVHVMGLAIIVGLAILAVAGAMMLLYVLYYYVWRGWFARTTTVPATITRKHQSEHSTGGSGGYDDGTVTTGDDTSSSSYAFFLTFDARGTELEFPVSERVYADVEEGDVGLLVHKGTLFRRFVKDAQLPSQAGLTQIRKVDMKGDE